MIRILPSNARGAVLIPFPGGSDGKTSAYNAGDLGSILGLGRSSGEGNGNPLQYSWKGKSHGQRSVVGYSPRGHKELDTTEQLRFALNWTTDTGYGDSLFSLHDTLVVIQPLLSNMVLTRI